MAVIYLDRPVQPGDPVGSVYDPGRAQATNTISGTPQYSGLYGIDLTPEEEAAGFLDVSKAKGTPLHGIPEFEKKFYASRDYRALPSMYELYLGGGFPEEAAGVTDIAQDFTGGEMIDTGGDGGGAQIPGAMDSLVAPDTTGGVNTPFEQNLLDQGVGVQAEPGAPISAPGEGMLTQEAIDDLANYPVNREYGEEMDIGYGEDQVDPQLAAAVGGKDITPLPLAPIPGASGDLYAPGDLSILEKEDNYQDPNFIERLQNTFNTEGLAGVVANFGQGAADIISGLKDKGIDVGRMAVGALMSAIQPGAGLLAQAIPEDTAEDVWFKKHATVEGMGGDPYGYYGELQHGNINQDPFGRNPVSALGNYKETLQKDAQYEGDNKFNLDKKDFAIKTLTNMSDVKNPNEMSVLDDPQYNDMAVMEGLLAAEADKEDDMIDKPIGPLPLEKPIDHLGDPYFSLEQPGITEIPPPTIPPEFVTGIPTDTNIIDPAGSLEDIDMTEISPPTDTISTGAPDFITGEIDEPFGADVDIEQGFVGEEEGETFTTTEGKAFDPSTEEKLSDLSPGNFSEDDYEKVKEHYRANPNLTVLNDEGELVSPVTGEPIDSIEHKEKLEAGTVDFAVETAAEQRAIEQRAAEQAEAQRAMQEQIRAAEAAEQIRAAEQRAAEEDRQDRARATAAAEEDRQDRARATAAAEAQAAAVRAESDRQDRARATAAAEQAGASRAAAQVTRAPPSPHGEEGGGGAQGSGGSATGGGWCFDPNTFVQMADDSEKKIKEIQLGDKTKGGEVTGTFQFKAADEIHDYKGVTVAGSHYVKENGEFIMVQDSPLAVKIDKIPVVYSLDTTGRRIFIKGIEFADYNGDGIAKNFLYNAGRNLNGFNKEVLRQVENKLI